MKVRYRLAALSALGLLIASPAAAGWDGRGSSGDTGVKSGDTGHVHKCGCGHKGWDCKPGSSSGGSPSSSGSSGGGWSSTGGSSGGSSGGDSGGTPVPEPADFALFAAGVMGLIIGRRGSRVRRR